MVSDKNRISYLVLSWPFNIHWLNYDVAVGDLGLHQRRAEGCIALLENHSDDIISQMALLCHLKTFVKLSHAMLDATCYISSTVMMIASASTAIESQIC